MASENSEKSYILDVPDIEGLPWLAFEDRKHLPMSGGIYFVYVGFRTVLYVGSSKNIRTRWNVHHRQQQIATQPGARIAWMVVEHAAHRLALEHHCIDILRPLYQQTAMPQRRDKRGKLIYEVKLHLSESTFLRLSEASRDYHRTLPNQIIFTLKRLIESGQLDKWARSPDERSWKGDSQPLRRGPGNQLKLFG